MASQLLPPYTPLAAREALSVGRSSPVDKSSPFGRLSPTRTTKELSRDTVKGEIGVGLSDPVQSQGRRKMLDLINRLHSTGVQLDIDLPMIAVIGSQSAGKSSLIESISGITLPRASGTCTRCPTECRLSYSEQPWKCTVSLRFTIGKNGEALGTALNIPFGSDMFDKDEVEDRIRRAQRAILNPNTEHQQFLIAGNDDPTENELSFSTNCISLQVSGKELTDLSFCDLPGLIASVGKNGNVSDIDLVKNLVSTYILKPSCLILLTVACETDFENQGAHHMAKQYDPEGKRTIGVLTKPDRIQVGEEDRWLRFIRNDEEPLENGWFAVKQPNSQAISRGISWDAAREQEKTFFSTTEPWSKVEYQQQFGTQKLTARLSNILSDLIKRRLPELQQELQNLLKQTSKGLRELPTAPSSDPTNDIIHLVAAFTRDVSQNIEGTPEEDGLLQSIRPLQEEFRKQIRATAPDFRPYSAGEKEKDLTPPSFLSQEEQALYFSSDRGAMYIDKVMDLALKAKTRELPDNYPFIVSKKLINNVTELWDGPSHDLFEEIFIVLTVFINKLAIAHFGKHTHGGLQQHVEVIITDVLKQCHENTLSHINWLLGLEHGAFTLNERYYSDYKDKFLSYYRGSRQKGQNKGLMEQLEQAANGYSKESPVSKIMVGLSEIGMKGIATTDIAKLLPPDPFEPALHIMAGVRAYYQVAHQRFSDNIPMAIDQELLRGLDWDRGIEQALLKGLGVNGPEGLQRCKDLLQEPPNVLARRGALLKKQERLLTARKQLMSLF